MSTRAQRKALAELAARRAEERRVRTTSALPSASDGWK
jgi:hypothetical protein